MFWALVKAGRRLADFLVAYVDHEKLWYVFPVKVLANRTGIYLFPHARRKRSQFEEYRDAWKLLGEDCEE